MRDGFFDVNDMERFADDEEDLHYGVNYDEEYREGGRQGDTPSDDSGDEDTRASLKSGMRKKFRGEDEMDVLAKLYQGDVGGEDDDVDSQDEAEPTAEEFFGKPSLRVVERYKERYNPDSSLSTAQDEDPEKGESGEGGDSGDEEANESQSSTKATQSLSGNSSHEAKSTKLLKQTEAMEEDALAEKPWTMTGEVTGGSRPVDSLLEAAPEFEQASKLAPAINLEHTENLEEVIKRRILGEDWDDVLPRELPSIRTSRGGGENATEISQEKSKLGLGEIYERDYLKKAVGYDVEASEKESSEEAAKAEIKALFAKLCSRLDALSNYHFSPRPVEEEAEVKNLAAPAIAMEEVMPLTVSDARASAPEEVFSGKRGRESVLKGDSELRQEDRKRLRATKKQARRKERKQRNADEKLISRLKPGLGLNNPYEARKLKEDLSKARSMGNVVDAQEDANKDYNTSTQFFARMQQQVKNDIHGDTGADEPADYGKKRGKGNKAAELLL
jgi:U3 small nucleolar RNA-associated protein MPP10